MYAGLITILLWDQIAAHQVPLTLLPVQTGILPVHATEPGPSCLPELQGHMVSQESYPLHGVMHTSELVHSTTNHITFGRKSKVVGHCDCVVDALPKCGNWAQLIV